MEQELHVAKPGQLLVLSDLPLGHPVQMIDDEGVVVDHGLFWGIGKGGQPVIEKVLELRLCPAGYQLIEPRN